MATALLEGPKLKSVVDEVKQSAQKYALSRLCSMDALERAVMLAEGITILRKAVTPLLPNLMPLMHTPLGFDSDKNPNRPRDGKPVEPYPVATVVDCLIEAMLRGLNVSGGEWMIISGKTYTTQLGYKRLVRDLDGISDLDWAQSPPFQQGGNTCVKCRCRWKLKGMAHQLTDASGHAGAIYSIKVNAGMGIDAILGKAERRMWKTVYQICTGTEFTEPNIDEAPALAAPADQVKTRAQEVLEMATQKAQPIQEDNGIDEPPMRQPGEE